MYKSRDFHAASNYSEGSDPYPEVEDVTEISFVKLKHRMISLYIIFLTQIREKRDKPM